ncbi:MAG: AI-2E family transporter [Myxococcales bacterium]|nr:AI-2E family transporter [Myxococcales bacterium]
MAQGSRSDALPPRWVLWSAGLFAVGWALWALREVLTPLFFAWLLAYLLDPLVDRLERLRLPRSVAIVALLVAALGAIAVAVLVVVPLIVRDVAAFAQELPARLSALQGRVEPWLAQMGVRLPHSWNELTALVPVDASMARDALAPAGRFLGWLVGGTASAIATVAALLIVPVLAFYLLHDFDRITAAVRDLLPVPMRPGLVELAREIDAMVAAWVRGQTTVMLVLGILYAIAFSLLGVRLGAVVGLLGGLLAIVPYVGGAVCLLLALLMCALDGAPLWTYVGVVLAYGAIQAADGLFITPRVVGERVGLPAVAVLVAMMIGGELLGLLGVLLAVPAAAIVKILGQRAIARYRRSRLFLGESGDAVPLASEGTPAAASPPPPPPDAAEETRAADVKSTPPSETAVRTEPSASTAPQRQDAAAEQPDTSEIAPSDDRHAEPEASDSRSGDADADQSSSKT